MENLKNLFLLDPEVIYLNHGSFGATPRTVFEAYQAWQMKLERQPVQFLASDLDSLLFEAREKLAIYLKTSGKNLLFIPNATFGVNMIARSINLRPGDEILTTDHEYGACDITWRFICQKTGAKYIPMHVELPAEDKNTIIEAIASGITSRTRILFISHISSPTSIIFPVEALIRIARENNIITLIDGAHAPGQIGFDLDMLEADFYIGNCHKWLMAPKGSAFLYARTERQATLEPLIVSWGWDDVSQQDDNQSLLQKFSWMGTHDPSSYLAIPAAIEFHEIHHWPRVRLSCHALAYEAMEEICYFTGLVPVYTQDRYFAQMVTIPLPHIQEPKALKNQLLEGYKIEIPIIEWSGKQYIRLSVQGYNSAEDIEVLCKALRKLL